MGNSLFGSRAVPGSIPAELTEHPMVRHNNVTAPTQGRYREIPERLGDSSHRNDIQFGTEPKCYTEPRLIQPSTILWDSKVYLQAEYY